MRLEKQVGFETRLGLIIKIWTGDNAYDVGGGHVKKMKSMYFNSETCVK